MVYWNEKIQRLALVCDDDTYILKVNQEKIHEYIDKVSEGSQQEEDGCEEGFDLVFQIQDKITSGVWLEDVFIYVNNKNKISYNISDKIFPITALNKS